MTDVTIKTNNHPRDILSWHELAEKERKGFDHYLDTEDRQADAQFARYRGNVYDLGEMQTASHIPEFSGWHGYDNDTFFSGTLVRFVDEYERVVFGRFYS